MTPRPRWLLLATLVLAPAALSAPRPTQTIPDRPALLARLGADRWHAAGHRGRGVTVAVLDTGFRGWRAHLGAALPRTIPSRSFRADGLMETRDSQHGILCGEVVH